MLDILYKPPQIARRIFSKFQWQSKCDKILLTFDDGPTPHVLPLILDFLQKHNLQAAFFLVGSNIAKNPALAKEILSAGHLLANHTQNHQDIILCSKEKVLTEISDCSAELLKICGEQPAYFRPPHGRVDWRTARFMQEQNLKCVMWSLLTGDFTNNRQLACNLVKKHLSANSIVTLHDNIKAKEILTAVLETVLETADKKGFILGTPVECLT